MCVCMGLYPHTDSFCPSVAYELCTAPLRYSRANCGSEKCLSNSHIAGAGQSQQRPVDLTVIWVRGWFCLVYACTQIMTKLAICIGLAQLHRCPGDGVVSQLSGHWNAEAGKVQKFTFNTTS